MAGITKGPRTAVCSSVIRHSVWTCEAVQQHQVYRKHRGLPSDATEKRLLRHPEIDVARAVSGREPERAKLAMLSGSWGWYTLSSLSIQSDTIMCACALRRVHRVVLMLQEDAVGWPCMPWREHG